MNLIFRLLAVILAAWWRPRMRMNETSELRFRVWPLDLDLNLHLTNSRYLSLMDLGRTDLILRSGAWKEMRRQRLGVVLAGSALRFRRPLAPFARFTLATKLIGCDERWLYVMQVVSGPDGLACTAVMRAAFVKKGKLVPPEPVLQAVSPGFGKEALPAWVAEWAEVEAAFAE
ncbi:thioesterase family protein [Acidocella aminolytica]|jgi:acyl-CoA thioesterase FadM|uniref:Thioesterase n=1 Tax=Acidocella aminolytica 101 = DSM 11237 TaxID=1120923 RepID=A0A0D6PBI6_9PROT|nr:thioesterase family protein [Acidocella aminolytica]GAN78706.1 thioesterase [Acidocella aminolytica 101 = DSM 11237]GBQ33903.1 thioesterase superfamily protein [Acidocella aminolytica 101 = DSM 11237]SHE36102.1 Acyl-CoA thioesterase FadM [Acidocella aminolytica 101 = DSM 11237]